MQEIIIVVSIILLWGLFRCLHTGTKHGFSTKVIKQLTEFNGRKPGTLDHYHSYLYLLKKIKSLNVKEVPWAPGYTQNFMHNQIQHKNLVFMIKGELRDPKIIVFAHYDHIGPGFPGGNDNASGVYALLQIAEKMSQVKKKDIYYDIIFVLSDGEERGMTGSKVVSDILPANNLVINIDTIGGFPDDVPIRIANDGNYQDYFIKKAVQKKMDVRLIDIKPARSDITHFLGFNTCVEFGYPTSDGHYHSPEDTYENLYLPNMFKIIEMVGDFIEDASLGKLLIKDDIR